MEKPEQRVIYLWTRPRSLSTAFVRTMSTLEGCQAINEPYILSYFADKNINIPGMPDGYGKTQEEILQNISHVADKKIVFIKEMPGHLGDKLGDSCYIPEGAIHTFLIRHPVKTMKSFIKMATETINVMHKTEKARQESARRRLNPEALKAEQSFDLLNIVYDIVVSRYGQKPIIVDADDLQRNPEGMLRAYCKEVGIEYNDTMVNWGQITPEQKAVFNMLIAVPGGEHTHRGPIAGTSFVQSEPEEVTVDDVDEVYRGMMRENIPHYEKLRELRLKPHE